MIVCIYLPSFCIICHIKYLLGPLQIYTKRNNSDWNWVVTLCYWLQQAFGFCLVFKSKQKLKESDLLQMLLVLRSWVRKEQKIQVPKKKPKNALNA